MRITDIPSSHRVLLLHRRVILRAVFLSVVVSAVSCLSTVPMRIYQCARLLWTVLPRRLQTL